MTRFPIMLVLALPLLGAGERPAELGRFGDFTYDASAYAVEGEGGRYTVRARDDRDDDQTMIATVREAAPSECSMAKLQADAAVWRGDRSDQRQQTMSRDGFEVHLVSWFYGCRNARPPSVLACTAYRGRVYRFEALAIGCQGGPGFGSRPDGFLGSLAPAP